MGGVFYPFWRNRAKLQRVIRDQHLSVFTTSLPLGTVGKCQIRALESRKDPADLRRVIQRQEKPPFERSELPCKLYKIRLRKVKSVVLQPEIRRVKIKEG